MGYSIGNRATWRVCRYIAVAAGLMAGFLMPEAGLAQGDVDRVGGIEIVEPWSRVTPKGAKVGAGYLIIRNTSTAADRLMSAQSAIAKRVEIHEMKMDGDVMRMRALGDGLTIPAGGSVELKPGGYHIMFLELAGPIDEGQRVVATLRFEKAGDIEVQFVGRRMTRSSGGHGGKMRGH